MLNTKSFTSIQSASLVLLMLGSGAMLLAVAPNAKRKTDPTVSKQAAPVESQPLSIPLAYEQLGADADQMLHQMTTMLAWAKISGSEELRQRAFKLMFRLDEEFTTPLSKITVDAWEYGKEPDRYRGYSQKEFWSQYHVLSGKKVELSEQVTGFLDDLAKHNGVDVQPFKHQINIFSLEHD